MGKTCPCSETINRLDARCELLLLVDVSGSGKWSLFGKDSGSIIANGEEKKQTCVELFGLRSRSLQSCCLVSR